MGLRQERGTDLLCAEQLGIALVLHEIDGQGHDLTVDGALHVLRADQPVHLGGGQGRVHGSGWGSAYHGWSWGGAGVERHGCSDVTGRGRKDKGGRRRGEGSTSTTRRGRTSQTGSTRAASLCNLRTPGMRGHIRRGGKRVGRVTPTLECARKHSTMAHAAGRTRQGRCAVTAGRGPR